MLPELALIQGRHPVNIPELSFAEIMEKSLRHGRILRIRLQPEGFFAIGMAMEVLN